MLDRDHPASGMSAKEVMRSSRHISKGAWDQMEKELFKNNKQGADMEIQYFSKSEMIHFVNGHSTKEYA